MPLASLTLSLTHSLPPSPPPSLPLAVPLASLKALAKHHADLQQHLPADDAEEAVRRVYAAAIVYCYTPL